MTTFPGIYRGTVAANLDPLQHGRVQVEVPALGDGRMAWAEPCAPYAGDGVGMVTIPPVGASVWVGFEGGDESHAVLLGGFWGGKKAPGDGLPTTPLVYKTDSVTLTIDELPGKGGLTLAVGSPAVAAAIKIACTSSGIELSVGSTKLVIDAKAGIELSMGSSKIVVGPSSVSINNGALEVT